jgi:two-component system, NarL family, response regulator
MSLRVLLVEDDELFRLGLRVGLQQEADLEIVAETDDGETAIELAMTLAIDVVLLDVGLPGLGGIETCSQLRERLPQLPVLVLTSHNQPALIARLIAAGAQGYCLKGLGAETLVLALRSVAAGASWWDRAATQMIQQGMGQFRPEVEEKQYLTQREKEVLTLIAAGRSNPEIATALYIAPGTVRVHVHGILHKLGVENRSQAVVVALQNQLIDRPEA